MTVCCVSLVVCREVVSFCAPLAYKRHTHTRTHKGVGSSLPPGASSCLRMHPYNHVCVGMMWGASISRTHTHTVHTPKRTHGVDAYRIMGISLYVGSMLLCMSSCLSRKGQHYGRSASMQTGHFVYFHVVIFVYGLLLSS